MKVTLIFRDRRKKGKSIEGIFKKLLTYSTIKLSMVAWEYDNQQSVFRNLKQLYQSKTDLIHITGDIYHLAWLVWHRPVILTFHDIGRYKELKGLKKILYKWVWVVGPIYKAKLVTTVSFFTLKDIIKLMPSAERKISVIHNGIDPLYHHIPKAFNTSCPRILQVGTAPHKNLDIVIKGLQGINSKLVIIGDLEQANLELLNNYKIEFENYKELEVEALRAQYVDSDIIVFISSHEGFGMPILEAQATGRVVVTSKAASIPEVTGDGAYFLNNHLDPHELNSAIRQIVCDPALRQRLINAGLENSSKYSYDRMAKQYLSLYHSVGAS